MYQEDWEKKNFFQKSWKKSPSRPFLAHPASGQETTFYSRVASGPPPGTTEPLELSLAQRPPIGKTYTTSSDLFLFFTQY